MHHAEGVRRTGSAPRCLRGRNAARPSGVSSAPVAPCQSMSCPAARRPSPRAIPPAPMASPGVSAMSRMRAPKASRSVLPAACIAKRINAAAPRASPRQGPVPVMPADPAISSKDRDSGSSVPGVVPKRPSISAPKRSARRSASMPSARMNVPKAPLSSAAISTGSSALPPSAAQAAEKDEARPAPPSWLVQVSATFVMPRSTAALASTRPCRASEGAVRKSRPRSSRVVRAGEVAEGEIAATLAGTAVLASTAPVTPEQSAPIPWPTIRSTGSRPAR